MMTRNSPIADPHRPKGDLKGRSAVVRPAALQARRNRMWERQIEPQAKKAARPAMAMSQLKTVLPAAASFMNARRPNPTWMTIDQTGRPFLSTY